MSKRQTLTILVPVYNESLALPHLFARLDPVIKTITEDYNLDVDLLFTNNCSTDDTLDKLKQEAAVRPYLRIVSFSRNVGFQRSILSGYAYAIGDACVQIDADLEDPPEMILKFIEKWREGFQVIYGVRMKRHESIFKKWLRSAFYIFVNALSEDELPKHAGDFRLIDKRVMIAICRSGDSQPYIRGAIASFGFKSTGIEYDRSKRSAGESAFNMRSYISMSFDGILQNSLKPLHLSNLFALASLGISTILGIYFLIIALTQGPTHTGFYTIVLLQLVLFSFIMSCIGILGLYIGRIYRQVLARPLSITVEKYEGSQENIARLDEVLLPGEIITSNPSKIEQPEE